MKPFMFFLSMLAAMPCLADDPPGRLERLEDILRRADSEDAAVREASSADLARWRDEVGDEAEGILEKAAAGRSAEVRGRIEAAILPFRQAVADRKLLGMLDAFGLPNVSGLKYVEFNTGKWWAAEDRSWMYFRTVTGWVVEATEEKVTIETEALELLTLPRRRDFPADWVALEKVCRNPEPKPGEFREILFEDVVKEAKDGDTTGRWLSVEELATRRLVLAWWSYQRGDLKSGHELLRKALDFLGKYEARGQRIDEFQVASVIAGSKRISLISSAHAGMSRTELRDAWSRILGLPENPHSDLAKQMAAGYEAGCRQDEGFRELSGEELGKLDAPAKAAYWIHLLRDVNARGCIGKVNVLLWGRLDPKDARPLPPWELCALGYDAIPALIEHLDDACPTRSMGCSRHLTADSFYLLSVGEACEQILEAIKWLEFYESRPDSGSRAFDGRAAEVKKAALEWWDEAKLKTREERLLILLGEDLDRAAPALLRKYGRKHLARIVEEIEKQPDRTGRLLPDLKDVLGPEHADLLRAMLKAKDGVTLISAAGALVNIANDTSGLIEIVRRLREGPPLGPYFRVELDKALPLLAKHARGHGVALVVEMLGRDAERPEPELLSSAACLADPEVLDALVPWLDRRKDTGTTYGDGYRPRFCDEAAEAVARMTGWPPGWSHSTDTAEKDRRIADLKSWLAENREKLDWEELQKKPLEDMDKR